MGRIKHSLDDLNAGGLDLTGVIGKHACRRCLPDAGLKHFAKRHAVEASCDYCGRVSNKTKAVPMSELIRFIDRRIATEFDQPENGLGRDQESSNGWDGEVWSTSDLLDDEFGLELQDSPQADLRQDILDGLGDRQWCPTDPYGPRSHDRIGASWEQFRRVLMHERRFFFMQYAGSALARRLERDEAAYDLPGWLDALGRYALRNDLIVTLPKGTTTYRVQIKKKNETAAFDAARMGPPPRRLANQSNRMSPPGVPMFYGAADSKTALLETVDKNARYAVGRFETRKDVLILDLSKRPPIPSIFDERHAGDRRWAMFMRDFLGDFTKAIERDDRVHVAYVPTQAVTEFFRTAVRCGKRPIKGIRYRSARKGGTICYVLFADQSSIVGAPAARERAAGKPWLEMIGYEEVRRKGPQSATPTKPKLKAKRKARP
jgi:hypothetical protein